MTASYANNHAQKIATRYDGHSRKSGRTTMRDLGIRRRRRRERAWLRKVVAE